MICHKTEEEEEEDFLTYNRIFLWSLLIFVMGPDFIRVDHL